MTPEEAESIFYAAYRESAHDQHMANSPVNQARVRKAAWQAVIDAVAKEIDTDWAKRFLAMQEYHNQANINEGR